MFSRFSRLGPYFVRNRRILAMGAVALFLAHYLDIKLLVMLGFVVDSLRGDALPLGDARLQLVGYISLAIVVAVLGGALARFMMRWLIIGASREIEFALRNDLFAHLQRLSPSFFHRHPTGDLMARATNDLESIRLVIGPALMYFASTAVLIPMSLIAMIHISTSLTIVTWLPLMTIAPLFYAFHRRIHRRFTLVQERFSDMSTRVQETLTGVRVIKAAAREADEAGRFDRLSRRYVDENIALTRLQAFFIPLITFTVGLSLLALVWTGSTDIARGGGLTYGEFISFFTLLMANIWPMAAIGWVFSLMERGAASMARIDALFDARPEIAEPIATNGAKRPEVLRGDVSIRNLTFAYPGADRPALIDVSIDLPAGRTLGLTGPVGCGKSTLASLLARRYNPPRGAVFVDGVDILDWPLRLYRSRVGVVDQEPFVFSDTIRANVGYGLTGETDGRIERMSDLARLAEDLESFPRGLETMLGERGINLSGGQRQRAALARALAIDPALLILDDSLAAVDTHTEEEILRGLIEFMRGRTTILISHRIRTVSVADRIVYLEAGRIVEEGTHEELLALRGRYRSLSRKQKLAEEIEATA